MPNKVVLLQAKMFEYDDDKVQKYIEYNRTQIMECLISAISRLWKDPDVGDLMAILCSEFSADVSEIAHYMVGIRRNECRISQLSANDRSEMDYLKLQNAVARLEIGNLLLKIADVCLKLRLKKDQNARVITAMEELVMAIESLPRQNFYATFSGVTLPH